jgi:hypothetical protein
MSFPPPVKESALVSCARHCCVCHRFRGLKIECHHIVQEADGGENSYENCIPLCFDCHADMRSYDDRHPRGTKYRPDELRNHRDAWYAKIAESGGAIAAPQHAAVDRTVFIAFRSMVPWKPLMLWIKEHHFGGAFDKSSLDQLYDYRERGANPDDEFLDAELEGLRGNFRASLVDFLESIATHTFATHHDGIIGLPDEWKYRNRVRWDTAAKELNERAESLVNSYTELVRATRTRLGVA